MQSTKSETTWKKERGCPFLGLTDDPGTALSYPSSGNNCHHSRPVAPVNLMHQVNYCLNSNFAACPVYLQNQLEPLPREIGIGKSTYRKRFHWVRIISIVGIVVIIAVLIFLITGMFAGNNEDERRNLAAQTLTSASLTMSSAQILETETPTPVPTQIETPTPVPTQIETPTATTATQIPTTIPMHQLEMPIGEDPSFVIHQIQEGENFVRFSEVYNASREAILAVNYGLVPPLWAGAILVIPVGVSDATGLPSFTTYNVTEDYLTIESLAEREGINPDLLEQYNGLPAGYIFTVGEWVLIPH